ncbi:MAG: arylsulfatase A-like enzyme [Planctomycetota bacterium]|jgi:arylsulfatase A-like enzyme
MTPLFDPTPKSSLKKKGTLALAGLLCLFTGSGCSEPAPPEILRLLDLAETQTACTFTSTAKRTSETLFSGADLEWEALPSPARETGPEADALFLENAVQIAPGELQLGGSSGAWASVIPVEPDAEYKISTLAELTGLTAGDGFRTARFLLVDLADAPQTLSLLDLQSVQLTSTWSASLTGDQVSENTSLVHRTHPKARQLGLFFFLTMEEPNSEVRVVWKDIRIHPVLAFDHLTAASDSRVDVTDSRLPPIGDYSIAGTQRPSIALLSGDRLEFTFDLPEGRNRLDAWIGISGHKASPDNASASLTLSMKSGKTDSKPLGTIEVSNPEGSIPRWLPIRLDLCDELAGQSVTLTFEAETSPSGPVVLALANPRVVPEKPRRHGQNVLLISIDTLRADRLGTYGGPRDTSPIMDALADESMLFETAWSTAAYTLPSHVSLLSGQLPGMHGVQRPAHRIDSAKTKLLAELLGEHGYSTAAFTAGGFVDPDFGFSRGFESYGTIDPVANLSSLLIEQAGGVMAGRDLDLIKENGIEAVTDWIENHSEESFMLFFHTYITHQFDPSPEAAEQLGVATLGEADRETALLLYNHKNPSEEQRERLLELYDASVRQADHAIGQLLDCLRKINRLEDTIIVLTSDHGKEIGEHGAINHGHSLHRELLKVPMILRIPGATPQRLSTPVSGIDVYPTILELLNLPLPREFTLQGSSLLSIPDNRSIYAEVENVVTGLALLEGEVKTIVMIEGNDWDAGAVERSYNLTNDPFELSPLEPSDERRQKILDFGRALRELSASKSGTDSAREQLDPKTKARLEGLGYTIGSED